ncbi:MAG: 30S ribosomal protein S15 [Candidatus Hadarchaeales archaeon]
MTEGKEVEELVVKLAREGHPPSRIGILLRDLHGVGSVKKATGKSVSKILEERGVKKPLPEDLANLVRRALRLQRHLEKNRKDKVSLRSLEITEQRIRKLSRYYVKVGRLPRDWRYEREKAALLVR